MADSDNRASILVLSGDMDKVFAAFIIATGAASTGMDTTMFFTFWGTKAIQKDNLTGKSFFGRMLGLMNRGGINVIGPSRFNFLGAGRWLFKKMMRDKKVASLEELRQMAIDLGVHLLACGMTMDVMEITREDLIPEVEDIVGVGTFLQKMAGAKVQVVF
jgi:peroxiredoxin family protein